MLYIEVKVVFLHPRAGIIHILCEDEQKILVKGPKSHQKFIKRFTECLNTVSNFEPNDFVQWFSQMNMLRNKADYKPVKLGKQIYEKNVQYARDFAQGINNNFKLY